MGGNAHEGRSERENGDSDASVHWTNAYGHQMISALTPVELEFSPPCTRYCSSIESGVPQILQALDSRVNLKF